jgi:AraC-like DNA-binding protein
MNSFLYMSERIGPESAFLIRVNRAGRTEAVLPCFDISRDASCRYTVIHAVTRGTAFVVFEGCRQEVHPGEVFVLPPGAAHRYGTGSGEACGFAWVELDGEESARLARAIVDERGPVIRRPSSGAFEAFIPRLFGLLGEGRPSGPDYGEVSKLAYGMLVDLLAAGWGQAGPSGADARYLPVRRAMDKVQADLSARLSIEVLAREAGLSPAYFARLFRRLSGLTPARYVELARVEAARERLRLGDETLEAMAEALGFCTASHLVRVFRRNEGLTPIAYRRQSRAFDGLPARHGENSVMKLR